MKGHNSSTEGLCCCEYENNQGDRSHILACCCDCEALDQAAERCITCQCSPRDHGKTLQNPRGSLSITGNSGTGGCEATTGRRRSCNHHSDLSVPCHSGSSNDCSYVNYHACISVVVLPTVEEEHETRKNSVLLLLGTDVGSDHLCGV